MTNLIAAAFFRSVQLCVGSCDDLLKALIRVPRRRHANTDRHANGSRTLLQWFSRSSGAQPFGNAQCVVGASHRQNDGEFLASDPPDQVDLPQSGAQAVDDVQQSGVAYRMPVSIIDHLEVIDVNHQ